MKKLTVALLAGGTSSEREVSLSGGDEVFEALDKSKYTVKRYDPKTDLQLLLADAPWIDVALIILHGILGEDGSIQGMLNLLGIPYQGSQVLGSALAMNKIVSKQLYKLSGLPVPPYISVKRNDSIDPEDCVKRLGLPLLVKPANGGSSIGMSLVRSKELFKDALDTGFSNDDTLLIEAYMEGTELTGSVIGNDELEALPIVEIIPGNNYDFFNYTAKYTTGATREICPAEIDDDLAEKARSYAKMAHRALCCKGYSRTDMILVDRKIYLLETNTIPGMTSTSLLPLAARTAGINFSQLLDKLIALGIDNHRQMKNRR
jgi:D-alanine-D-alanine ligase